jgi:3-phosphoglycerate kinase
MSDAISQVADQHARAVLVSHETRIGKVTDKADNLFEELKSLQKDVRIGFFSVIALGIVEGFLKYFKVL